MRISAVLLSAGTVIFSPSLALVQNIPLQAQQLADLDHSNTINADEFDTTFNHSHITPVELEGAIASYGSLDVQIRRIGATDRLIFVEMTAENKSFTNPVIFDPENASVMVEAMNGSKFEVLAHAFASQTAPGSQNPMIEPGGMRHITVVYPAPRGQGSWNPTEVAGLEVHLFSEGGECVQISFAEGGVEVAFVGSHREGGGRV